MTDKKIIAVIGATGAQGGGVARAILNDPESEFAVRAITRNPESEKAKELAALGAEVVAADMDDYESVKKAFDGAYGAFCITNYWEHFSPEREQVQAMNLARAAKDDGLKHVIWSTLEDTRRWVPLDDDRMPTLMGKYKVPHLDAKGEMDQVFTDLGVPTTFLLTSFYYENFIYFGLQPKVGPDGKLAITLPMGDKPLPSIAVNDIGKAAYRIFKGGDEFIGKTVAVAGDHLTGSDFANGFTKALGREVVYNAITPEDFRGLGFPGADDLGNMFQFKADFNEYYAGIRNLDESRKLNPELLSFKDWLAQNIDRIPVE